MSETTSSTRAEASPDIDAAAAAYIDRAKEALYIMKQFTQEQVDAIAHEYALTIYDQAEEWSRLSVEETGLGNVPDKVLKKKVKAEQIWHAIKDKKTVGVIGHDYEKRMMTIAEPIGVVAGIAPCTNPVVTAMSYALLAIKTRNALIVSPHPRASNVTRIAIDAMIAAGRPHNLPRFANQVLGADGHEGVDMRALSRSIMSKADMVVATGGPGVVKVAYGSGTPAYGVGAGNTPVIVHESADLAGAAKKIIDGRAFDNGIICASEQHLIVAREEAGEFRGLLEDNGAYFVEDAGELARLKETLVDADGRFQTKAIGKAAGVIAGWAGLEAPDGVRVLVVHADAGDIGKDAYSGEKMFPMLTFYTYDDFTDAVEMADDLLRYQGKGHTAGIHIDDDRFRCQKDLMQWAFKMPATHLMVNQPTATSAGGSKFNWMTASTTLGCGSYGGTTPLETINLSVKQLLNYKIVSMPLTAPRLTDHLV